MMNKIKYLISIAVMLCIANICLAQEEDTTAIPVSNVTALGRYTDGKGVEMRFFPDQKSVMELGFINGFSIERALFDITVLESETDTLVYKEIAKVKPYNAAQWETAISQEQNSKSKQELEIARDFLNNISKKEGGVFDLNAGIAGLKEQKSKEDFEYLVFAITALQNAGVAKALGLGYTDNTVIKGKTYIYRIRPLGVSSIYKVIPVPFVVETESIENNYDNEVYVMQGDKELFFAWLNMPEVSGFMVERANPGETTFTQLNEAPIRNLEGSDNDRESRGGYHDTNLINYQIYTYRFFGYTVFGEKVQFAEVKAMPKDLTPPENPFLPQPTHLRPKEVLVTWKMNEIPASDLKGFVVGRSNKSDGEFKIIHKSMLSKETRTFTDTGFVAGQLNYYVVQAFDTSNNVSSSFPVSVTLIDSVPPAKPQIISALIDSLGVVTLTVKKGTEKDLMGYKLFKANGPEHEFSAIQEAYKEDIDDTISVKLLFTDTITLQSLTPKIYYRVKALDYNYNQSAFSDIAAVKKPDTIPPVTPVFTNVVVKEKQVELYFAPSESIDVKEQIVYRKTDIAADWTILLKLISTQKQVIDTAVQTGTTYYYSIRAMDESNLYSDYAHTVYGKPFDSGIRPPVTNVTASLQDKKAVLTWDYPPMSKEVFFVIYKINAKGELQQYTRITEKTFIDKNTGKENVYAIKALTADGGQSILSASVTQKVE